MNTQQEIDELHHKLVLLGEGLEALGVAASTPDEYGEQIRASFGHATTSLGYYALYLASDLEQIKDRVTEEAAQ